MLAIVLGVFALLQLSTQQELPGLLLKGNQSAGKRIAVSDSPQSCDGSQIFSNCGSCDAVNVCLGDTMDWRYCPYINSEKPFCNNGECSATPSYGEDCPRSLYCNGEDARACDIYHFCEGKYQMSLVYKCPNNYVFNPETNFCKRKQKEEDCMKVTCNVDEIFSRYGTSKRFFGYCRFYNMGPYSYEVEIHKCPEGTLFNGKTCSFECPAEGRFPNVADTRGYYECYFSANDTLSAVYQQCPSGKVYEEKRGSCVQDVQTTVTTPIGLSSTPGYTTA
ncbi:uncharacterized protein LOC134209801 [Armigeres subalbatus]|uniref:uncharacterized protein LOC134209801 n=1 Tax=Armigeres subalbatus TaxID=124917 RepID=UPI002ED654D2